MRQRPIQPGDFEYESFTLLEQRGHRVERIGSRQLRERYPAWNSERYLDGFSIWKPDMPKADGSLPH
jgi:hypothetical protein